MYYHSLLTITFGKHYWWDLSKDEMIKEVIVPFVNGQVVKSSVKGQTALMNMSGVTYLQVFSTQEPIEKSDINEIREIFENNEFLSKECTDELLSEIQGNKAALESKSLLQQLLVEPGNHIFVIMKFGDKHLDSAYTGVIKPVIEESGFEVLRIDEVQDSGKITDQVLQGIATSHCVLADLTGERPNCYYETGFAHAIGKEMILTIRKGDSIHFDLAGYRFIEWETEADLREALRKRLKSIKQSAITA